MPPVSNHRQLHFAVGIAGMAVRDCHLTAQHANMQKSLGNGVCAL